MKTLSAVLSLAAIVSLAVNGFAQITVLTHATVIDGTGAAPENDVSVVIENGVIRDMGPSSKITAPAGAAVMDLTGKFIVPGIINAHGHVDANRDPQLRQYALYGVTTTTNMGFDPDDIAAVKAEQKRGNLRGARSSPLSTVSCPSLSNPAPN